MTFAVKVAAKARPKYGPHLLYGWRPNESALDDVTAITLASQQYKSFALTQISSCKIRLSGSS
jgi:hypothetical protein